MNRIFFNGNIVTMESADGAELQKASAMWVCDGRYAAVGSLEEVRALSAGRSEADGRIEEVDLRGATVLPAFTDSHMHVLSLGMYLRDINLTDATSIAQAIEISRRYIEERQVPAGQWIRSRGWNHDHFTDEARFLNRYDLDKISTVHPLAFTRTCGHIISVNSKALELMGMSESCCQVEGGQIDVDENGRPLGIFREAARKLVLDAIPEETEESLRELIRLSAEHALSHGITEIHTDDFKDVPNNFQKVIHTYMRLKEEGNLKLRIYEQCNLPSVEKLQSFLDCGYHTGWGDSRFKLGPFKVLQDGSLGARTALMRKPYADDPSTCGIQVFTQEELDAMVELAQKHGMQIAIHAIGDGAIESVQNSIERAQKLYPREDERHGIIHCQITDPAMIARFARMHLIAYIQPIFLNYDLHIVENRIGSELAATSYAWKSYIENNVVTAGGSDCPVESLNIMENIYAAVVRKDLCGFPADGWHPEQALSVAQAVRCFTLNPAYASFSEGEKGSIKQGKIADFVLLDQDIFSIEPEEIRKVNILATYMDGIQVYEKTK